MSKEAAVRSAATALFDAIVAGRKAGLVIRWPSTPEGLQSLAISETAKAAVQSSDTAMPAPAKK